MPLSNSTAYRKLLLVWDYAELVVPGFTILFALGVFLCAMMWLYETWVEPIYHRRESRKRLGEIERQERDLEEAAPALAEQRAKDAARLAYIVTASGTTIHGRQIIRQLRMVSIIRQRNKDEAELALLLEVEQLGGNGVLNMRVSTQAGNLLSVQGDAVLLE